MIDDFKRIKKDLFNTIAENEITIKKLNKQIREDNGKVLIKDVFLVDFQKIRALSSFLCVNY